VVLVDGRQGNQPNGKQKAGNLLNVQIQQRRYLPSMRLRYQSKIKSF